MSRSISWPAADYREVVRRAALWLVFLAPIFFGTYGAANWLASLRPSVPSLAFGWERHIPFVAWTIIPYWSIDLLYAIALFINDSPKQVGRLARRYLTAQLVAVSCFIALPLQATFVRPETGGLPGFMFDLLGGFDKPFNQAPSLHIALLVIIWDHLRGRFSGAARIAWHVWCLLIGLSVLTTWQHHVIDIPTGALLGLFALWLWPDGASPAANFRLTRNGTARRLAIYYCTGALFCLGAAIVTTFISGAGLLYVWPALALAIVAFGYAGAGAAIFQKDGEGHLHLSSWWLLLPYRLVVRLNIWAWTRRLPAAVLVRDGVYLGRFPQPHELAAYASVLDMTGELPRIATPNTTWRAFPALDLLPIQAAVMNEAALLLEELRQRGPVLVCCALGFQRSASVVACWLVRRGLAADGAEAARIIASSGRRVHLTPQTLAAVAEASR